jgi:hypothetical protein
MQKHAANALLAAVLLITPLSAQLGRSPMPLPRSATSVSRSFSSTMWHDHSASFPRAIYLGTPLWFDESSSPYTQTPSVVVIQTQPAPVERSAPQREEPTPASPLMIEWQGDRYVRRTEVSSAGPRSAQPDYIAEARPQPAVKHPNATTARPSEPPPATFFFRDGHREESSDYSIISGVIYARGDYWTNGYWSKQIPLSQLDLPSTFKVNQERGVTFRLPGAPNEVVTRP